jgi:hypothetical protein
LRRRLSFAGIFFITFKNLYEFKKEPPFVMVEQEWKVWLSCFKKEKCNLILLGD